MSLYLYCIVVFVLLFSAGMLMWSMFSGKVPFFGEYFRFLEYFLVLLHFSINLRGCQEGIQS